MPTALEVKREILARCAPRKQRTVEGVWRVLEALQAKGVRVFSVGTVASACEEAGLLSPQSIYNAGGADYRTLIQAFADEIGATTSQPPRRTLTPLDEAIESIKDLDVRTKIRAIIAENRKQRLEIDRLKEAFKYFQPVSPTQSSNSNQSVEIVKSPQKFIDLVPLEKFLSDDWLEDQHWHIEANGAVYTADGSRITPVGFAPALSSAVKALQVKFS